MSLLIAIPSKVFVATQAQGVAGGASFRLIAPYVKKEREIYSIAGAPQNIRDLSDKCSVLFRLSEAELWKKIYDFREADLNGEGKRWLDGECPEIIGDFTQETAVRVCQVLQTCFDLENEAQKKQGVRVALDALINMMQRG